MGRRLRHTGTEGRRGGAGRAAGLGPRALDGGVEPVRLVREPMQVQRDHQDRLEPLLLRAHNGRVGRGPCVEVEVAVTSPSPRFRSDGQTQAGGGGGGDETRHSLRRSGCAVGAVQSGASGPSVRGSGAERGLSVSPAPRPRPGGRPSRRPAQLLRGAGRGHAPNSERQGLAPEPGSAIGTHVGPRS